MFTVTFLKYTALNTGKNISMSTTLKLQISTKHGIVSYGILHIYLKGKAVPLQAWIGPEGSRNLRFLNFMTTAQDGDKVVNLTHRLPLPPFLLEAESTHGP
jgi:hypothetical protein